MFVSKTCGVRAIDTEITVTSGFINLISDGDVILSDQGVPHIETDVDQTGGVLVMPPFKSGALPFSSSQNKECYEIASVRIHVERCIARLNKFKILSFVPSSLWKVIDKILPEICFVQNYQSDLIQQ